ncbi:phage DNA ejection protein [Pectobacterium carotovorum]|uniref:phage DNA ejection protein n=1 Tax=Pectobacterium carotovorum TaxID=554 RepID=UPI0030176112
MATWDQNINSGSFLAGIGKLNENAPRASDVNATLGLIRDNNDFARAGGNNVGLQALQGLSGLADAYKKDQLAQRQKTFQQEYGNAFKSGDRNAMRDLAAKYPDQFESVQKGMGFIDDDHRTTMGNLAMNAQVAAGQGSEAFGNFLKTNATELNRIGINPADVGQTYQQNPQGASDLFGNLAMFSLGPKGYLDALDKREGRTLEQGRLTESARQADMENARGWGQIAVSRENSIRSAYAPTAAMQNYTQYAQMTKTDPEGAKAFAQAAGINTDQKKLMKVEKNDDGSVTKYYTDGSEESGKLLQPISADGIRPISLPQAQVVMEKAPEGAKKAAGFAYRVRNNLDAIDALKVEPKRIAMINTALGQGNIGNLNLSGPEQQYVAYAGDSIAAVLRQESGAAIPLDEQMSYYKRYFPQVGDSENTIKTKRNLMENQFKALRGASGRAYDALTVMSAADPAPPTLSSHSGMQDDQRLPSYPGEQQKPAVQTKSWSELP